MREKENKLAGERVEEEERKTEHDRETDRVCLCVCVCVREEMGQKQYNVIHTCVQCK